MVIQPTLLTKKNPLGYGEALKPADDPSNGAVLRAALLAKLVDSSVTLLPFVVAIMFFLLNLMAI